MWSGLNAAALDGIRRLALDHALRLPANRDAVSSLDAADIPVITFSQVLSDAFAGRGWLDLLTVLDGVTTNSVHRALAELLRDRRCSAVITTNFDTLIERACEEAGFEIAVVLRADLQAAAALEDSGGGDPQPAVYKVHGTVSQPESMVDLLLDKRQGLGTDMRSLVAAACRDQHLVVLGFSGEDFAMDADYLGLTSSAAVPARVTWFARPGSDLSNGAGRFLGSLSARGVPVVIEYHDLAEVAGAASSADARLADAVDRRLQAHVDQWLARQFAFPPVAALILAELLRLRGQIDAADAVRTEVRAVLTDMDAALSPLPSSLTAEQGMQLASLPAAWALLGKEQRGGEQALADMRHAEEAMDREDRWASKRKIRFRPEAIAEQLLLRAAIRQNTAIIWFQANNTEVAARFLASAEEILDLVRDPEAIRRRGGICYQRALLDLAHDRLPQAMAALEQSVADALACGDAQLEASSSLMLAMCLRAAGDWELADILDRQATELDATTTTDAHWRRKVKEAVAQGTTVVASGIFDGLVLAMAAVPPWDELPTARASGDPARIANALVANTERDLAEHRGARLGQMLLSLALATGDTSPTSRFAQTVHALCSTDLTDLPDHIRFLLRVTALGLDTAAGTALSSQQIDELQALGRPFGYRAGLITPKEYGTGLHALSRSAAQAGVEAFARKDYEHAEGLYYLGYRGLWLVSEYQDAVRAELYRFESLQALGRHQEAATCLDNISVFASRHLPIQYLTRRLSFLSSQAQQGDPANWPAEAENLARLAINIAQRSPSHANRAMLVGALNIAMLNQVNLARDLMSRIDTSALSGDDTELLAQVLSLTSDT
jgi:tetratricopeptide (TPR) repeat protein